MIITFEIICPTGIKQSLLVNCITITIAATKSKNKTSIKGAIVLLISFIIITQVSRTILSILVDQ